jgi:peptide/nickel transport system substrate-binding protein
MKLRSRAALAAMLTAGALVLTGCGTGGGAADGGAAGAGGGTLTIGSLVDVTSFDPAASHVGHYMQYYQPVYDTLLLRAPNGDLEPMLATEWEYDDTNTELTLTLRDDVTFSDGEKFDAEAVKANIDHFKLANGPQASTAASIENVRVEDTDTAVIELSQPDPAILLYMAASAGFMASPAALDTEGIISTPVGSGPYELDTTSTVVGATYTYKKRADYWNPDLQKFDTIVVKPMTDVTARVNALVSGQLNATLLDPKTSAQATGAGFTETTQPVDWQGLFLYDRAGSQTKALGDVRVRQAINYAIDRQSLLDSLLLGNGEVTSQITGKASAGYVEELDDYYDYDPEKAKDLLAEAGYPDGFEVTLPVNSADTIINAAIVQQLADVGITATQVVIPSTDYRNEVFSGKYSLSYYGIFQGDPWVAVNHHIGPNAAFNPLKYSDETSTALLERIQAGDDDAAKELTEYITEQAWFAPFFRVDQLYFTDKTVTVQNQVQQAVPSIYNYAPAN